jgi:hypothetical protein
MRRSMLSGRDMGQMLRDLEREVLTAKREGHERIVVSYAGKLANVLTSAAAHAAYPTLVIEQQQPQWSLRQRLLDAERRGATKFISLRPPIGWVARDVEAALASDDEEED